MAGRRPPQNVIVERRIRVRLDVLRGLSIAQIVSKRGISEKTVDRDLAALKKTLAPEDKRRLRQAILANTREVFKRAKAQEFISFCQKILLGRGSFPQPVLPRLSGADPRKARRIILLLLTTDKSLSQVARKARTSRKSVRRAYHALRTRGDVIDPRGKDSKFPKRPVSRKENQAIIDLIERTAQIAGLTMQENAVVYCKLIGMQQREMAGRVGVSKQLITKILKSAREKMSRVKLAKP